MIIDMEIDKSNLSKHKYVYHVYESSDNMLHIEKYPVIYINSQITYYKDARKQERLSHVNTSAVRNDFVSYIELKEKHSKWWWYSVNEYFWNITNIEELFERFTKEREKHNIIVNSKNIKKKVERTKIEYEKALEELKLLEELEQKNGNNNNN